MNKNEKGMLKVANILYKRYEYLADQFVSRLYEPERIGFERKDVQQELRLKVFLSIIAYIKAYRLFKETGLRKPVPIEYYIRTSLNGKINDLIGATIKEPYKISMNNPEFRIDIGKEGESLTTVDWKKSKVVISDVDILQGLTSEEKPCFCLFLKGFTCRAISNFYQGRINAKEIVNRQIERLKPYEHILRQDEKEVFIRIST